jgi:hypothetical protein
MQENSYNDADLVWEQQNQYKVIGAVVSVYSKRNMDFTALVFYCEGILVCITLCDEFICVVYSCVGHTSFPKSVNEQ